jgi:peroxiredoxin Q/BCP
MKFPSFSLSDADGTVHKLKDYAGQPLVVYFYPKDNTTGCTVEACAFRDAYAGLKRAGVAVLGVSPDDAKSHQKFTTKHGLNFPLLVDEDHRLASELGVWAKKSLYGRSFMGIVRSTFLIDAKGGIAQEWRKVKLNGHVDEVVAAAKALTK